MIKPRRVPWPRPADTALDRARAIAREYRAALAHADPARCATLDAAADHFGETWLAATPQYADTARLLTLAELADTLGEKPGTVRQWAHRGVIPREPCGLVSLPAVLDALATRRITGARTPRTTREVPSRSTPQDRAAGA